MSLKSNYTLKVLSAVLSVGLLFSSCQKNRADVTPEKPVEQPEPEDKPIIYPKAFAGIDTTSYNSIGNFSGVYIGEFHILSYGRYTKIPNDTVRFRGTLYQNRLGDTDGSFEVMENRIVCFRDTIYRNQLLDNRIFLNGNYRYYAKGDSLILHKILPSDTSDNPHSFFQYRLKRVAEPGS